MLAPIQSESGMLLEQDLMHDAGPDKTLDKHVGQNHSQWHATVELDLNCCFS